MGQVYRVADKCDYSNNVDIYQMNAKACIDAEECICWKMSPLPSRHEQKGGYPVTILSTKV